MELAVGVAETAAEPARTSVVVWPWCGPPYHQLVVLDKCYWPQPLLPLQPQCLWVGVAQAESS